MKNWDDLRVFLEVGRRASFQKAGQALDLNKSTVLRRVASLEAELGLRLVEMRGRQPMLTDEGRRLLSHAQQLEESVLSMKRDLLGSDAELSGKLVLTTTETIMREILAPAIAAFLSANPRIKLDVATDNRALSLTQGEADLALRYGERPTEEGAVFRQICDVGACLYASRSYVDAHGYPRSLSELRSHRALGFVGVRAGFIPARVLATLVDEANLVLNCADLGSQTAAVEAGVGIALLPCFVGDSRERLVRISKPLNSLQGGLWLIWHREARTSARLKALVDHLTTHLKGLQSVFDGSLDSAGAPDPLLSIP